MRRIWKFGCLPIALLMGLAGLKELFLRQVDLFQNAQMMEPSTCRPNSSSARSEEVDAEPLYTVASPQPFHCNPKPAGGYTVALVPGGRRDRMRLLISYLDILLSDHSLDEVHIWDTSKNLEDKAWMERMVLARPRYRFFRPPFDIGKRLRFYDFYAAASGGFKPLCPGATPESTVLMKIDDDIVFINTTGFPLFARYVRTHPQRLIVFANIANNGVAAYYQSQRVAPLRSALPELSAYPVRSQRPGFCGPLFNSARRALQLHRLFVEAPERFAWDEPESDHCIEFGPPEGVGNPGLGQGSFSVNFFGVRWDAWHHLPELLRCVDIDFDEPLLSVLATRVGYRECMFTQLNVAHLSFRTQEEKPSMREALPLYEALLRRHMNVTAVE